MKEEEERTPLRTILQNFLNHIEKLDKEKLEGSYDKEFQELKLFSEFLKTSKQYSCSQGEKEVNRKKNRYKDILPFDCSRVILEDYAGIPGSDYINANYIKGASGSPAYIASQGPLPHTVNDFWRMVVQCEVQVIVMACNEEEAGKHKCENYWVEKEGEEKQFGMVAIQLMKASVVCPDFLVRTMRLKYTKNHSTTQEERTVCQFHYSAWPDHGVPPLVRPLLDMVRLVRDTQASETLPVLVHCSAGCGRTGTICAIDYVWGLLRAGKLTRDFSLFKLVREMRKQRIAMVQTKEQYILVHHAVKELFNEQLRMIDSHPYENIDVNGMVKESPEPEPLYATITPEIYNEEKQDSNEKDVVCMEGDDAPPLPCKRKPYTAHTKQEKEVENLSQKHRSTVNENLPSSGSSSPGPSSSNSSSISGGLLHKPRIAKLRALFERTSNRDGKSVQVKQRSPQQVTRSHSLGAVRKLEDLEVCVQPIPNKGILRVPQLSANTDATYTRNGRPALPIKRSKSLKVLSSGERSKFSVPGIRGTFSPESQNKNPTKDELRDQGSSLKISIPVNDMFIREEVKPHVPPKKVQKDKVSERKTSRSPCGTRKLLNAPNVSSSSKMSEETCTTNKHLSSVDCWKRRSLDSLPFESELPASSVLPSASHDLASSSRKVLCRLDDEAKKLFQDCRDYLNERTSCESSEVTINSDKQVQSQQGDTLKNITVEAQRKVHAVVVGLGIRERRNSFRQAISKDPECSRTCDYESLWPRGTKEKSSDRSKLCNETQSIVIDKSPIDPSSSRKKFLSQSAGHTVPMQIQQSPARTFRPGKMSVSQKTEQQSNSLYPKSTLDLERGVFIPGKGSFGGHSEHPMQTLFPNSKEGSNLEIRRAPQLNVPANTNLQQSIEPLYLKGNVEQSRHDPRPSVSIPMSGHSKSRNICPNSLGATEDSCRNSERRMPGHSFTSTHNSDAKDSKCMNVPLVRQVNTAFKGRCVVSGSRIKHSDQFRIRNHEIPATVRNIYSEDTQIPQPLLGHHETSHPTCVTSEISIVEDVNSTSQGNLKGQVNSSITMKQESIKASKYSERAEIGSGAVRRVNMLPGPGKVTSGSQANGPHSIMQQKLDHRFWGVDPGISGVRVLPGVERETSVTVPEGDERSVPSTKPGSRVVPKMNLKQKDAKVSENSSCSNSSTSSNSKVSKQEMEAWIGAPGIDVDMVGASIKPSRDHGTPLARALEAFHFRKSSRAGAVSPQQQRKVTQPQVFVKKQHYL